MIIVTKEGSRASKGSSEQRDPQRQLKGSQKQKDSKITEKSSIPARNVQFQSQFESPLSKAH